MALMTVFVIAYLWLFRSELRFPAAFLLLPAGVAAIWVANVVRIAVLIAIGASWSPDVAVVGWHSQAGWIGFSIVALLLIALAHRLMHLPGSPAPVNVAGSGALPYLLPFLALMFLFLHGNKVSLAHLSGSLAFIFLLIGLMA